MQAVHLAIPNVLHYAFAKRALNAGKHVFCEKPLAMTSKQSAELVELAAARQRAAAVCYNLRFYPLNLQARDMAQRGDLGSIHAVNGSYAQDWLLYDTDYNWRVLAEQGGELRAVSDIGTHWIDLVLSITGLKVQEVFADLLTVHTTRQRPKGEVQTFTGKAGAPRQTEPVAITTDDYGQIIFRFSNGARGGMYVSQVSAGRKNCLRYEIAHEVLLAGTAAPEDLDRRPRSPRAARGPGNAGDLRAGTPTTRRSSRGFPDTFKHCSGRSTATSRPAIQSPGDVPDVRQGHHEVVLCERYSRATRAAVGWYVRPDRPRGRKGAMHSASSARFCRTCRCRRWRVSRRRRDSGALSSCAGRPERPNGTTRG